MDVNSISKQKKVLTQNLNLLGKGRLGELSLTLHHSSYKDFLDEQETCGNTIITTEVCGVGAWFNKCKILTLQKFMAWNLPANLT